ncbi:MULTISPECIES: acylase [unclassified Tolypothrix]|uniref:acylase n=1 Tax=unclassified Tolypothrix TaxID=2649714 RepID=UPI0005EABC6E|nr:MULTISPECIES: acylase [unclassified Tolypothrix]BAY94705.1 peptidase S45, penicillin amidase [Microchaete diplosiphon NIES-3275]EKE99062.1 penicillin amidase [Tolypothrix sp. PCC 7601]MBE9081383.1 acylase [Tolypothrix sp. LEGE 11397]UYD28398.1 acylase [Tolypothrix sp. PCC 7712]UYD35724.1 acylase [Tolypothrix sp. PCC 7601]
MNRKLSRFLAFILCAILVVVLGNNSFATAPRTTEILWDTYGIPHIYGKDVQSAFRAFGWAQMQSHANLLLRLYGQARGKAAEYWGEDYLESDKWVVTMGVPNRANSWYQAQSPAFKGYINAFANGINTYAKAHPDLIDDDVEIVLPVKPEDVLAHLQRVLYFTFIVNQDQVADNTQTQPKAGSNGWAIAPKHSASGKAMLLANPHLLWSDLFLWYEAQLTAPGMNAYGATLVGIPVLAIAFNDNLGWTHTVNTHDGWDLYELKLADGGYLLDDKVRPFTTENFLLKVKQKNGSLVEQPLLVKSSVQGAVVQEKEGKALALRVVGLDRPGVLEQWWDMAASQNLDQFQRILQRLQLPMFTVMYADREGHIMHLFNGLVPIRQQGDFQYWQGLIPGDTSKTLWTKMHPYQDLPRVIDPPSGWLQNANDPPWTTTFPVAIKADDYPAYMAPRGEMDFRAQSSAKMLAEDNQISFAEMIKYKHSTNMELAERILDDLIPAAQKSGNELTRRAANILAAWDRNADADSRGAVLFSFWWQEMSKGEIFSIPWSEKSPRTTPDGLKDPDSAAKALQIAATKVEKAYGKLNVAWGEVFRLHSGNLDLPANGGDGDQGIFRTLYFAPAKDERFQAVAGDSYVAAIEFSQPIKAMALLSYGNATQPGSPHITDQLPLFARKQLRPIWRTRPEILANLEERKTF